MSTFSSAAAAAAASSSSSSCCRGSLRHFEFRWSPPPRERRLSFSSHGTYRKTGISRAGGLTAVAPPVRGPRTAPIRGDSPPRNRNAARPHSENAGHSKFCVFVQSAGILPHSGSAAANCCVLCTPHAPAIPDDVAKIPDDVAAASTRSRAKEILLLLCQTSTGSVAGMPAGCTADADRGHALPTTSAAHASTKNSAIVHIFCTRTHPLSFECINVDCNAIRALFCHSLSLSIPHWCLAHSPQYFLE